MTAIRLMPLHIGKGRTIAEAIYDSTDNAKNPLKTEKGSWPLATIVIRTPLQH